ncbi:MAG: winged helix-turn-helix transcriptional regulator [bacterium]|nr:winged helix-turn-helix transcriptional regulator [bacterium]
MTVDDPRLDETFAALANSTRGAILERLAEGEASVNDLAAPLDLTVPAVSKHLMHLPRCHPDSGWGCYRASARRA